MSMLTYLFNVELVSLNPSAEDTIVDIDHNTVDIEAIDEKSAIEAMIERYTFSSDFFKQTVSRWRLIGTYEEETF